MAFICICIFYHSRIEVNFAKFSATPIPRATWFQLMRFPLVRYSEQLSSESTNTNFEINLPLARKEKLIGQRALLVSRIVQPYWTILFHRRDLICTYK